MAKKMMCTKLQIFCTTWITLFVSNYNKIGVNSYKLSKKVKLVKATDFLYFLTTIRIYLYIFCSSLLVSCIMMLISFLVKQVRKDSVLLYNFEVSLFIWVFKVFWKCLEYLWTVFEQLLVVCSLHFDFSAGSLALVPPLSPLGSLFFFCVH